MARSARLASRLPLFLLLCAGVASSPARADGAAPQNCADSRCTDGHSLFAAGFLNNTESEPCLIVDVSGSTNGPPNNPAARVFGKMHSNRGFVFRGNGWIFNGDVTAHRDIEFQGGNSNTFTGHVACDNFDINSGNNNAFVLGVEYAGTFRDNGSGNTTNPRRVTPAPACLQSPIRFDCADYDQATDPKVQGFPYQRVVGDRSLSCSDLATNRIWYITGKADINCDNQTRNATIIANTIVHGKNGLTLSPVRDGLVFLACRTDTSSSDIIRFSGERNVTNGFVQGLGGKVEISGNENDFNATVAADRIRISGNDNEFRVTANNCPLIPDPDMTLEKSLQSNADQDQSGTVSVGDTLTYAFEVENTGNVPLTGIRVTDPLIPTITCNGDATPPQIASLAPGAMVTCTGTYTVTQQDVDNCQIDNTATADSNETDPISTMFRVTIPKNPDLDFEKSLQSNADEDQSGTVSLGDTLTYAFELTNAGNVTLTNVSVTDPRITTIECNGDTTPPQVASLAPGAMVTCTGTYVVTQQDVDAGEVDNTATADSDQTDPIMSMVRVPIQTTFVLEFDKFLRSNADEDQSGTVSLGDTLTYAFEVENAGNATLTGVSVTDPRIGTIECNGNTTPPQIPVLAPGAMVTCTGTYAVTQQDVDAGRIDNTATADSDQTDPIMDMVRVVVPQNPALRFEKSLQANADGDQSGTVSVGDTLTYAFEVENTGNVTLTDVSVTDPRIGTIECNGDTTAPQIASLPPLTMITCTGSYVVTQQDVDDGQIDNTATADSDQTDPIMDMVRVTIPRNPDLDLDKYLQSNADEDASGGASLGDTLTYAFAVTNAGNVTLTGVSVVDNRVDTIECDGNTTVPQIASLAPQETVVCTGAHVVMQQDVDEGQIVNTATADSEQTGAERDTETVDVQRPGIDLEKSVQSNADEDGSGSVSFGDTLTYAFEVSNTGELRLDPVMVTDPLPGLGPIVCPQSALDPQESMTCTATYEVTLADSAAGRIENTATATGRPPEGPVVDDEDTAVVPVDTPRADCPSLDLRVEPDRVAPGQSVVVRLTFVPGPQLVPLDVYVTVLRPDGALLYLGPTGTLSLAPVPYLAGWLPETLADGIVLSWPIASGDPQGIYTVRGFATLPGTSVFVAPVDVGTFEVTP